MRASSFRAGATLTELLIVLVLIGVVTSLASPSLRETLVVLRIESVLDRLASDLRYARLLAAREGRVVELVLARDRRRCATGYQLRVRGGAALGVWHPVGEELRGLCLRSSGSARVAFDSRGLAAGSWQSLFIDHRGQRRAVVVSAAGRIRRSR